VFPTIHERVGEPTFFVEKLERTLELKYSKLHLELELTKIHTIRSNYPLWKKRFEKINRGEAVLELYYWEKPGGCYVEGNKQIVFCQLSKDDGIGLQKLAFLSYYWINPVLVDENDMCTGLMVNELAKNDGLLLNDFKEWFKKYDLSKPMAIIHFTNFRY
jgi:hypothetical protein